MNTIFQWIDSYNTLPALASLVCSDGKESYIRYFRWNFTQLADPNERIGTIEFRQPAGSTEKAHAICWTAFALSFVAGAIEVADSLNPNEVAGLQALQGMIRTGAVKLWGIPSPDPLTYYEGPLNENSNLFRAKQAWLLDPY
jgi:hypothetical protein